LFSEISKNWAGEPLKDYVKTNTKQNLLLKTTKTHVRKKPPIIGG
jgi:hypothetical protein